MILSRLYSVSNSRYASQITKRFKSTSVCVVGAGPAGFYAAQHILKKGPPEVKIDILERLPVPFGLVRFGVAPDHPDVKNVENNFTKVAENPAVRFYGNVDVGDNGSIKVKELREIYDAVVLAYGAAEDRNLGIPGENLENVLSARRFVGFYNGLPEDSDLKIDLESSNVASVIGVGNVAVDVARILLTPVDELRKTDITEAALEMLAKSRIEKVNLIGRRGPLHVAFTIAEFREMIHLPKCRPVLSQADFLPVKAIVPELKRPMKRLADLMAKTALDSPTRKQLDIWTANPDRSWELKLLRTPKEFYGENNRVAGIKLGVNRLSDGQMTENQSVESTNEEENLESGLVFKSVGYKSINIEKGIPFDDKRGLVPNVDGKVEDGLYCAGWLATGPRGVIVNTMNEAYKTGSTVVADLESITSEKGGGRESMENLLKERNVNFVDFEGWKKIDDFEKRSGEKAGKPREKMRNVEEMIELIN